MENLQEDAAPHVTTNQQENNMFVNIYSPMRPSDLHISFNGYPSSEERAQPSRRRINTIKMKSRQPTDHSEKEEAWDLEDVPSDFRRFGFSNFYEWLAVLGIIVILVSTFMIPSLKEIVIWGCSIWEVEFIFLLMLSGRIFTSMVITAIVIVVERFFLKKNRFMYFTYGIMKPLRNCFWGVLVVAAINHISDKDKIGENGSKIVQLADITSACIFLSYFILLVKTIVIKLLGARLHTIHYFDKIETSLFKQYLIAVLSRPASGKRARSMKIIGLSNKESEGFSAENLQKLNRKTVSPWTIDNMVAITRFGNLRTGNDMNPQNEISSVNEAMHATDAIFSNVVGRNVRRDIRLEDLECFMSTENASKALALFEGASQRKRISKQAFREFMVTAYEERISLRLTLDDTNTAIGSLNLFANVLLFFAVGIILVLILEIATIQILLVLGTAMLSLSFLFGDICMKILYSMNFLLVVHPFDVGDLCEIDGDQMIVKQLNVQTTVFMKPNAKTTITHSNVELAAKKIHNLSRIQGTDDAE